MAEQRYTRLRLDASSVERTPEGFIRAMGRIARPGILVYRNPDGTTRRELVPAETLHNAESLASLRLMPMVYEHPSEGEVTPSTAGRYSVGTTGEKVEIEEDGGVMLSLALHREDVIRAFDSGEVEQLSPGYLVEIEWKEGTDPEFGAYDAVQKRRIYNHLALTRLARGGPGMRIRTDSQELNMDEENLPNPQTLEGEAPPEPVEPPPETAPESPDARSVWIGLDAPASVGTMIASLRGRIEAALGMALEPSPPAHLTLLTVGDVSPEGMEEIKATVAQVARKFGPLSVTGSGIQLLGDGLVLALSVWAWPLDRIQMALLRRLAHLVSKPQHEDFIPHITVGSLPANLTSEQWSALSTIMSDPFPSSQGEEPAGRSWAAPAIKIAYGDEAFLVPMIGRMDSKRVDAILVPEHETQPPAIDEPWESDAAVQRLREWASGGTEEIDGEKFRLGFGLYDSEAMENLGAYSFPHHDVVNVELVTNLAGVRAALAAAGGGRSGQAVEPPDLRERLQAHLRAHLEAAAEEEPTGDAEPNAEGGEQATAAALSAIMGALQALSVKVEGLSEKVDALNIMEPVSEGEEEAPEEPAGDGCGEPKMDSAAGDGISRQDGADPFSSFSTPRNDAAPPAAENAYLAALTRIHKEK